MSGEFFLRGELIGHSYFSPAAGRASGRTIKLSIRAGHEIYAASDGHKEDGNPPLIVMTKFFPGS